GPKGDLLEPTNGSGGQTSGSVVTTEPTPMPGEVRATARGFGETATIRIYRDANGYCMEFAGSSSGTASCGSKPFKSDRPYLSLTRPAAKGVWLSGIVPADVETVRVVADDGRRWVQDVSGPAKAPDLGDVQLVLAALSGSRGTWTIHLDDANGSE